MLVENPENEILDGDVLRGRSLRHRLSECRRDVSEKVRVSHFRGLYQYVQIENVSCLSEFRKGGSQRSRNQENCAPSIESQPIQRA